MTNPVVSLYEQIQLENAKPEWRFPVMPRWTHKSIYSGVRDPAEAYLLRSRKSRSTAVSALNTVVGLLGQEDIESTPWHLIRYCEMNVLRRMLTERYAPATANKILSIVRGVLHQACELNLMSTDAYQRALAVPAIPGPSAAPKRRTSTAIIWTRPRRAALPHAPAPAAGPGRRRARTAARRQRRRRVAQARTPPDLVAVRRPGGPPARLRLDRHRPRRLHTLSARAPDDRHNLFRIDSSERFVPAIASGDRLVFRLPSPARSTTER